MNLKVTEKREKPLLFRTEITAEITFNGKTPSKDKIKEKVVKEVKVDESLVKIKKVSAYYGIMKATVPAIIYNNKADIEIMELKKKKKGKEKKEEKPAEEKKEGSKEGSGKNEEKPKESKKEGDSEEDKKD